MSCHPSLERKRFEQQITLTTARAMKKPKNAFAGGSGERMERNDVN